MPEDKKASPKDIKREEKKYKIKEKKSFAEIVVFLGLFAFVPSTRAA